MYNNFSNVFKNNFGVFFNTRGKVRLFLLGYGCSHIYVTGTCLYFKVFKGLSEDSDRIEGAVHHFYTSDFATHLSPYMLPVFLRRGCMNNADRVLSTDKSNIAQRMYAYSALTKICSNINAINYLADRNIVSLESLDHNLNKNMLPFNNLIDNLLNPKKVTQLTKEKSEDGSFLSEEVDEPEILFSVKIKAFENLLKSLKPEERELSYDQISKLVKLNKSYESVSSKESISRVLILLFENKKNVDRLIDVEFEKFNNFPLIRSDDPNTVKVEDLCPILTYLYSHRFKNDSLSNILSDKFFLISHNNDCISLINDSLRKTFNSLPPLKVPLQFGFWKKYNDEIVTASALFQISFMYALVRNLFDKLSPGQSRFNSLQKGLIHGFKTFRGLLLFQVFYVLQDRFIKSKFYFDNENQNKALSLSFLLSLSTFGSLAAVCSTQRYFFGPFFFSRIIV